MYFAYQTPIVQVSGPFWGMGDPVPLPGMANSESAPTNRSKVVYFPGVVPTVHARSAPCDCTDWLTANTARQIDLVKDRSKMYADSLDFSGAMTEERVAAFYRGPLEEHFGFHIRKSSKVNEVVVDDVEVTVHNFVSCLPEISPYTDRTN